MRLRDQIMPERLRATVPDVTTDGLTEPARAGRALWALEADLAVRRRRCDEAALHRKRLQVATR